MPAGFSGFADQYFNDLFEWAPTFATAAGLHQYDSKLEDYSAAAITHRIERLKELQSESEQHASALHHRAKPFGVETGANRNHTHAFHDRVDHLSRWMRLRGSRAGCRRRDGAVASEFHRTGG